MKTIRDLNAPPHVIGCVEAIIVRGNPREPARIVEGGAIRVGAAVRVA